MASPEALLFAFLLITKSVLSVTLVITEPAGMAPLASLTGSLVKKPVVVPLVRVIVVFFFVTVPVTAVVCACDSVVPGSPLRPGHPKSRVCAVPLDDVRSQPGAALNRSATCWSNG